MKKATLVFFLLCIQWPAIVAIAGSSGDQRGSLNADLKKIEERSKIEHEAHLLAKKGLLSAAITKYEQAMQPALLNREGDKVHALSGIVKIYILQGQFELAQKMFAEVYVLNPVKDSYVMVDAKIKALIEAKKLQSYQPIYTHVALIQQKYQKILPPRKFTSYSPVIASDIMGLLDYIGDYDAGIRFVDQILQYKGLGNRARADYVKVRQAFEQSKAEGIKSCFETQVPGEACVGHATQVVIQSDYIPW